MPFGLCNALPTFTREMKFVLKEFLDKSVAVYVNDILVYSSSEELHVQHLRDVLQTLQKEQFYANRS